MKVKVYELSSLFGDELMHVTEGVYYKKYKDTLGLACRIMEIDIPESANPHEDLIGRLAVRVGGKEHLFDDVLSTDAYGYPVIAYHDDNLGCRRTVRLKVTGE